MAAVEGRSKTGPQRRVLGVVAVAGAGGYTDTHAAGTSMELTTGTAADEGYAAALLPAAYAPGAEHAADGSSSQFGAGARSAVVQVAAALHAVNLFTRPVIVDDAAAVAVGRAKTRIFVVALLVVVLALTVLNAVQPATYRVEVDAPSLQTYADLVARDLAPVCACANGDVALGDVLEYNVAPLGNYTSNICAGLSTVYLACLANGTMTPGGIQLPGCSATDAGALLYSAFLDPIIATCYFYVTTFPTIFRNIARVAVGATLPTNATFQATATSAVLQELRLFVLSTSSLVQPLGTLGTTNLVSALELTAGARYREPENCTCAGTVAQASPRQQMAAPCLFQPAFDLRPPSPDTAGFTCNAAVRTLFFPLPILLDPAIYTDLMGLPPPASQYLVGAESLRDFPANATFDNFLAASLHAYFASTADDNIDYSTLAPGFMTANFGRLFAACAPVSCVYVYTSRPSALQVVTALLGVLSGVQTVLTLAVDRGYDAAYSFMRRRQRRQEPADSESGTVPPSKV